MKLSSGSIGLTTPKSKSVPRKMTPKRKLDLPPNSREKQTKKKNLSRR